MRHLIDTTDISVAEVDKISLTEKYVDSVKTECDAEFTTMDTDF